MPDFRFNLKKLIISDHGRSLTIEGIESQLTSPLNSLAILGESGMGKTSIFKSMFSRYISLWRLERPFEFECQHQLDNETIDQYMIERNRLKHRIGFATQFPYFFENKTLRENIFSPLRWKNIKWSLEEEDAFIQIFTLKELSDKQMSILSGGQRQLANIARMLVLKPVLAIIDECFSSMDEGMAHHYIDVIKSNFPNCTFLLTSHRKADVEYFGSKVLKLKRSQYKSGKTYVTQDEGA